MKSKSLQKSRDGHMSRSCQKCNPKIVKDKKITNKVSKVSKISKQSNSPRRIKPYLNNLL